MPRYASSCTVVPTSASKSADAKSSWKEVKGRLNAMARLPGVRLLGYRYDPENWLKWNCVVLEVWTEKPPPMMPWVVDRNVAVTCRK